MVSYVLIVGVVASVLLEIAGIALYLHSYGSLAISHDKIVFVQGHDFFSFVFEILRGAHEKTAAVSVMTAGMVVLILTPFVRVVFSVFYFAWEKNFKYVVITAFVLVVLILSLILH